MSYCINLHVQNISCIFLFAWIYHKRYGISCNVHSVLVWMSHGRSKKMGIIIWTLIFCYRRTYRIYSVDKHYVSTSVSHTVCERIMSKIKFLLAATADLDWLLLKRSALMQQYSPLFVLLPAVFMFARVPQHTCSDTRLMSPCALAGSLNVAITNPTGLLRGDGKMVYLLSYQVLCSLNLAYVGPLRALGL